MQKELSGKLLNMLTEFVVCEIGSKVLDGITYTLILKDAKGKELYNRYMQIRRAVAEAGYSDNDIFRVYEVCNGYIMDMDLITAKRVINKVSQSVQKTHNFNIPNDIIRDSPDQRRKHDIEALAKYIKSEYDKGNTRFEVALFSRNTTNRIFINGKINGNAAGIKYNAYAIRHLDIETINEKYLIPAGIRVMRLQPGEILPSKTGVSFILTLESMDKYKNQGIY